MSDQLPSRRPGRPRSETQKKTHSLFCNDEAWEWFKGISVGRGHKSIGAWVDARGRAPLLPPSQEKRRAHGLPTKVEADEDGGYRTSILLIQERHGYGTAELAKAIGVAKRTVEGWKSGKHPSGAALAVLKRLATDKPEELAPMTAMAAAVRSPQPEAPNARPSSSAWGPLEQLEELCSQPEPAELEIQSRS